MLVQKYLKELDGQEWYPPLSNARSFTQVNGWNTKRYFDQYYDDTLPFPELFVSKDGRGVLYLPATKIYALAKEVFVKYWHNPSIQEEVLAEYKKLESEVNELYKKYIIEDGVDSTPIKETLNDLKRATDATWSLNARVFFSIYFDQKLAQEFLSFVGSNIHKECLYELWEFISTPISDSFDRRHKKIFLTENKNNAPLNSLAKKLWFFEAAYHFVPEPDEVEEIFFQKYQKWLDKDEANQELKSENRISDRKVGDWEEKVGGFLEDEQKLARYLQWIIAMRDERKDVIAKFLTLTYVIGTNLFDKAGLSQELLYFAPMNEWVFDLEKLCEKAPYFQKIKKNAVILVHWLGETEVSFGEAEKTLEILKPNVQDNTSQIIIGQIGAPGKVSGRVRIVRDLAHDLSFFSNGNILVTGMTRPEFVPLMKRSLAIITDEGGITCHAAIIAREMKKPCIIGTKIATQVLKDGDLVEVDANNGVVKILERGK
jgi:phosphoenolpyruvate synthase/pyruvate phosphate dikinase